MPESGVLMAPDERLRRVVAMVDALPARGTMDALVAPMRPRLARLRPPRPMTLTRLLFVPADPLIVPAASWTPASPAIPRSALLALAAVVRAALGQDAQALEARMAGLTMEAAAEVAEHGALLWPRAATELRKQRVPADWSATGLSEAAHEAIVRPLSALLAEGVALVRLAGLEGAEAVAEADRLLRAAAADGPSALGMMLALLLRRLPRIQRLLRIADEIAPRLGGGAAPIERALEFLVGEIGAPPPDDAALAEVALHFHRAARTLHRLEGAAASVREPAPAARIEAARERLAERCRARFAAAAERLAAPAARSADEPPAPAGLEEEARALLRLEVVGRHLGDGEAYERPLREAAGRVAGDGRLPRSFRLRLAEILVGPDSALALVGPAG